MIPVMCVLLLCSASICTATFVSISDPGGRRVISDCLIESHLKEIPVTLVCIITGQSTVPPSAS